MQEHRAIELQSSRSQRERESRGAHLNAVLPAGVELSAELLDHLCETQRLALLEVGLKAQQSYRPDVCLLLSERKNFFLRLLCGRHLFTECARLGSSSIQLLEYDGKLLL